MTVNMFIIHLCMEHWGQVIKTLPHYRAREVGERSRSNSRAKLRTNNWQTHFGSRVAAKNVIKVHKMRRVCLSIFQSADGKVPLPSPSPSPTYFPLCPCPVPRADCDKCDKDMCKICYMCVIIAFYGGGTHTFMPVTNAFQAVAADLSKCLPSVFFGWQKLSHERQEFAF